MASERTELLLPVGRLVEGDLYKAQDKNADGTPKVYKHGPDAGKPRLDYYFAVAIAKTPNVQWWQEPWGQVIYNAAVRAWPQGQTQRPDFAWKVKDGDSTVPIKGNARGKRLCDKEGFPGHWIVTFSSGFAPKLYDAKGTRELAPNEVIKPGYYVQAHGFVRSNESTQTPGIYINHDMVAFAGHGAEIFQGPDAGAVGFGQGPLPAGASAVPLAQAQFPGQMPGQMPGAPAGFAPPMAPAAGFPAPGGMPGQMPGAPAIMAQPPAMGQVAVAPNPGILAAPGMPVPAMGMPPAAQPYQPQMPAMGAPAGAMPGMPQMPAPGMMPTPAAAMPRPPQQRLIGQGLQFSYEQWIGAGYTDAMLVAQGLMSAT